MKYFIYMLLYMLIGVFALGLLFAPVYFFFADMEHFFEHMMSWFIVYLILAFIYNCTPIIKNIEKEIF